MCLWAIYIFPGSVQIYPPAEKADPLWAYIIRSQTHAVEIGTEAPIFLFWDYWLRIIGIFSLQCRFATYLQHNLLISDKPLRVIKTKLQVIFRLYLMLSSWSWTCFRTGGWWPEAGLLASLADSSQQCWSQTWPCLPFMHQSYHILSI